MEIHCLLPGCVFVVPTGGTDGFICTAPQTFTQQIAADFSPLFPPLETQNRSPCCFPYHQSQQESNKIPEAYLGEANVWLGVVWSMLQSLRVFYLLEKNKVAFRGCGFLWRLVDVAPVRIKFCKSCSFISGFQNLSSLQWPILFLLLLQSISLAEGSHAYINPSSVCKPLQSLQGGGTR